ncbi:hypothetical protein C2E23DRAFT_62062 [Lenzites betulinus]|nr:hypothetical protein C2E23DRAFT_62062 [Lenzites betulinus]
MLTYAHPRPARTSPLRSSAARLDISRAACRVNLSKAPASPSRPRSPIRMFSAPTFSRHLAICHLAQSCKVRRCPSRSWTAIIGVPSRHPSRAHHPSRILPGLPLASHSPPAKRRYRGSFTGGRRRLYPDPLRCSGWSSADCAPDLSNTTPFLPLGMVRNRPCSS